MVELVYTHDSKSCGASHESSNLSLGTNKIKNPYENKDFLFASQLQLFSFLNSHDSRSSFRHLPDNVDSFFVFLSNLDAIENLFENHNQQSKDRNKENQFDTDNHQEIVSHVPTGKTADAKNVSTISISFIHH